MAEAHVCSKGQCDLDPDDLERAHHSYLQRGDTGRAVTCASWLAFWLLLSGETAHASGWIARGHRLLDEGGVAGPAHGYLLLPKGLQLAMQGDLDGAWAAFGQAADIGTHFDDRELVTLARNGQGRQLVRGGRLNEGMALLEEVMLTVTSGGLKSMTRGALYCSALEACYEACDVRRAWEWTAAMQEWCASRPHTIRFRGECHVWRADNFQLGGSWPEATEEIAKACEYLSQFPAHRAAGSAFYIRGELHRHRGEYAHAEASYREASLAGTDPQPGLALLRLAQGRNDAARAAVQAALEHTLIRRQRSAVLAASVEIELAERCIDRARCAVRELLAMAAAFHAPFLRALAARAEGHVLLADGRPGVALQPLREAAMLWGECPAPYELARTRVLIARAHRVLGDEDAAALEWDAAREVFARLGAQPDVAEVDAWARSALPEDRWPLTAREREVLAQVAIGKTNRSIADTLAISEKTVARHVSNIFSKLALSTRAAATAYAHRHRLV